MKKETDGFKKIVRDIHQIAGYKKTLGQEAADTLSKWVGSWTFISLFIIFFIIWILTNGYFILKLIKGDLTDPYPFVFLNLILAFLTAIQAPVILMSQNRQAHRDRIRAEYDFQINKKSEKEIEILMKEVKDIKEMLKRGK